MIYFSSDLHLGHDEIVSLCNRPFRNSTQMDKRIIRNFNEIVKPDDDLYILGDFSIKTKSHRGAYENWTQKLNGRKHLIMGNHDVKDPTFYSDIGFYSIHYPYFEVEEFICVHDPALSQVDRGRIFLCGHVHDLFRIVSIDIIRDIVKNNRMIW